MQSFTEAILRMFDDLEDRLAAGGLPAGAVRAYLFGGCAVHTWTFKIGQGSWSEALCLP